VDLGVGRAERRRDDVQLAVFLAVSNGYLHTSGTYPRDEDVSIGSLDELPDLVSDTSGRVGAGISTSSTTVHVLLFVALTHQPISISTPRSSASGATVAYVLSPSFFSTSQGVAKMSPKLYSESSPKS
jgi:hypothetical protein